MYVFVARANSKLQTYHTIYCDISVGKRIRTQHARLYVSVFGVVHIVLEGDLGQLALADGHKLWSYLEGVIVRVVARVEPPRHRSEKSKQIKHRDKMR